MSEGSSNILIMIAGPTAVGKSSFIERLLQDFPQFWDIITYTTRAPRAGESQGSPYFFVTQDEFKKKIDEGLFVEWANVHDSMYGVPRDQIEQAWKDKRPAVIDIDVQGAATIRKKYPEAIGIFLNPPSLDALRKRLEARAKGAPIKDLAVRLASAEKEMARAIEFTHILVNDEFEQTYAGFKNIIEKILRSR